MSCTVRGMQEVVALQELLQRYADEMETIVDMERERPAVSVIDVILASGRKCDLAYVELIDVYKRRAEKIANELQNKGVTVRPDAPDALPSIAAAHATQAKVVTELGNRTAADAASGV